MDHSSINRPLVQRIGKYRPLSKIKSKDEINRVLGPDWWIMSWAFFLILWAGLVMIVIVLSYDSLIAIILCEIVVVILILAVLYTFYSLITTDPGIIPKSDINVNRALDYFITLKDQETIGDENNATRLKIWETWMIVRPPRSFHCAKWDVWVEIHDHHWPWIGGWVGMRNHKKFVVFLLTTGIACFLSAILWLPPIIDKSETIFSDGNDSKDVNLVMAIITGLFTVSMGFTLMWFGLYHLWMACK